MNVVLGLSYLFVPFALALSMNIYTHLGDTLHNRIFKVFFITMIIVAYLIAHQFYSTAASISVRNKYLPKLLYHEIQGKNFNRRHWAATEEQGYLLRIKCILKIDALIDRLHHQYL